MPLDDTLLETLWKCPVCRGGLEKHTDSLSCAACCRSYETIDGIPDFRLSIPSWIDASDDSRTAHELSNAALPLKELVTEVYARREGWDAERVARRTREVLAGSTVLREDLRGWLKPVVRSGPFLDLGCGGGMLMAAASELATGRPVIGIDVSMTWLVVAKKLVSESGGKPFLAAGMAEALPLASDSIPAVVSLDVIEHVHDPDAYLAEIDRVLQPGGRAAFSTPNRFSLTAEPHVFVWGVGWLPQPLQASYVRWRSGKSYADTALMSSFRLARRFRRSTHLKFDILVPSIPEAHIAYFGRTKRRIARYFNAVSQLALLRPLFLLVSPFFRITGTKLQEEPAHDFVLSRQVRAAARLGSLAQATQWGMNW